MGASTHLPPINEFSVAVLKHILTQQLGIMPDTPIAVAYSGGCDSHVLLHAMSRVDARSFGSLRAIHVNHGLHPEADRWMRHCQRVCTTLRVPFIGEQVQVHNVRRRGLEAAARQARYACFARLIHPGEILLTAHHQDDQAETVLLAVLRAGGVAGLAAMPEITNFSCGRLGRPLLSFPRRALAAYALSERLDWIDDDTNRDLSRSRNFLRHQILPQLSERWPEAPAQMARSAHHMAQAASLLEELAAEDLMVCQTELPSELRISTLQKWSQERQRNLLRFWFRSRGFASPPEPRMQQMLQYLRQDPRTRKATVQWTGAVLYRYRDRLRIAPPWPVPEPSWRESWEPATPLAIPGTGQQLRAMACIGAGLSCSRIAGKSLSVRWRQGGEICHLPGRRHRHKLKKLLQAAGVPPWERGHLPLIYVDEELAAVADRWICQPYCTRAGEQGLLIVLERDHQQS